VPRFRKLELYPPALHIFMIWSIINSNPGINLLLPLITVESRHHNFTSGILISACQRNTTGSIKLAKNLFGPIHNFVTYLVQQITYIYTEEWW
jgi:hypothetical protein